MGVLKSMMFAKDEQQAEQVLSEHISGR